jgi:chorismate mutase
MTTSEARLRALRGATTVTANTSAAITEATGELLSEMLGRNDASAGDLVSVIFTSTQDLNAGFPATAAREIGISDVPLLCATEIDVPDAMRMCVRVLMHLYSEREPGDLRHVYLGDTRQLRADLPE